MPEGTAAHDSGRLEPHMAHCRNAASRPSLEYVQAGHDHVGEVGPGLSPARGSRLWLAAAATSEGRNSSEKRAVQATLRRRWKLHSSSDDILDALLALHDQQGSSCGLAVSNRHAGCSREACPWRACNREGHSPHHENGEEKQGVLI